MKEYFYAKNGEQFGPFTLDELFAEKISRNTLVWKQGLTEWKKAEMLEEINKFFSSFPPPLQQHQSDFIPPIPKDSLQSDNPSKKLFISVLKISLSIIIIGLVSWIIIVLINKSSTGSNNYSPEYSAYSEPPARELSPEELQAELKRKEVKLPLNYLTVDYNVRTNLLGTDIVEGTIYNSATMATFKDVTLLLNFETESNTSLGTKDEIIYDYIEPGGKKYFKLKFNSPAYTKYIGVSIKKAKPVKDM